jgi:hypothetical protein
MEIVSRVQVKGWSRHSSQVRSIVWRPPAVNVQAILFAYIAVLGILLVGAWYVISGGPRRRRRRTLKHRAVLPANSMVARAADPPQFTSLGWFRLEAHGRCATVECDIERPRDDCGLIGKPVIIDRETFVCTAVERRSVATPIQPGERISLWVKELP